MHTLLKQSLSDLSAPLRESTGSARGDPEHARALSVYCISHRAGQKEAGQNNRKLFSYLLFGSVYQNITIRFKLTVYAQSLQVLFQLLDQLTDLERRSQFDFHILHQHVRVEKQKCFSVDLLVVVVGW